MSFHRSLFVAVATLFAVGMAPSAFAQCCGGYAPAPVYSQPAPCGGCGTPVYAPIVYAIPVAPAPINVGCGVCGTPTAAVTFIPPVAPTPVPAWNGCGACAPAPVTWNPCNTCGVQTPVYTQPAPLYVVNQGPDYSGAGMMVPFRTYAPPAQYAPGPYMPPYAHRYFPRPYYHHAYYHPRMYYGSRPYYPHHYWRG
jgi:hypothetical protein